MAISLDSAYTCKGLVPLLVGHILEGNLLAGVLRGGDGDDPRWRARFERVEEQTGQQERGKGVEGEGHLQPIPAELALAKHPACVVDEHIEPGIGVAVRLREGADLRQRGQIGHEGPHVAIGDLLLDLLHGGLGLLGSCDPRPRRLRPVRRAAAR